MSDTQEKTQLLPPKIFTAATTGASIQRKWLKWKMLKATPTVVLSFPFCRLDQQLYTLHLVFTLWQHSALLSHHKPLHTRAHWDGYSVASILCIMLCNHRKHRGELCLLAGGYNDSLLSYLTLSPRTLCMKSLHSSTTALLIAVNFQEKSFMFPVSL